MVLTNPDNGETINAYMSIVKGGYGSGNSPVPWGSVANGEQLAVVASGAYLYGGGDADLFGYSAFYDFPSYRPEIGNYSEVASVNLGF